VKRVIVLLAVVLLICGSSVAWAADASLELRVKPGAVGGAATPVSVAIELPKELAGAAPEDIRVSMQADGAKMAVPGQVVKCGDEVKLYWVMAAAAEKWTATLGKGKAASEEAFSFKDTEGEHLDLLFAGRPVTRYMYARDTSDDERAWETYKVFHHVFDAQGEEFITQGAGRKNRFPHHRGLFLGFSRLSVKDGPRGDFWHMSGGIQKHQEFLDMTAGPVLARSTALIHWVANNGDLALVEERETTAYRQPGSAMLLWDFISRLTHPEKPVTLGGDPEHAGMQFRAHGDIDNSKTRYVFPEGVDNVKAERDMAWAAMNMTLRRDGDPRYTVQHINHPENPEGTRYSAYRDYGRFGAFPAAEIGANETLTLRYRVWVGPGEFPPDEQLAARAAAFREPPKVEVVK